MTIQDIERAIFTELARQKAVFVEPYQVSKPALKGDEIGDIIVGVDAHLNVTAIARAIVEASQ